MFQLIRAAAFVTTMVSAADKVPDFNVEASCRDAASRAAPVGTVDACMRKEREARVQLAGQWAEFTSGDKSHCLGLSTLGGMPTYTELLTCLELARDARNLRGDDKRCTSRQGACERPAEGPPY
jgi:putative N-acetylmannosamine-6-phosphate epimerase